MGLYVWVELAKHLSFKILSEAVVKYSVKTCHSHFYNQVTAFIRLHKNLH